MKTSHHAIVKKVRKLAKQIGLPPTQRLDCRLIVGGTTKLAILRKPHKGVRFVLWNRYGDVANCSGILDGFNYDIRKFVGLLTLAKILKPAEEQAFAEWFRDEETRQREQSDLCRMQDLAQTYGYTVRKKPRLASVLPKKTDVLPGDCTIL